MDVRYENAFMKFEVVPKEEGKATHVLSFDADETEVVAAAFREYIFEKVVSNPGSVEDFEMTVAEWDGGIEERVMKVRSYQSVIEMLEDFHENTREAMSQIPEMSGVPPFLNEDIALRYDLGRRALVLINDTKQKVQEHYAAKEDPDKLSAHVDMDEGIRGLLSGDDSLS